MLGLRKKTHDGLCEFASRPEEQKRLICPLLYVVGISSLLLAYFGFVCRVVFFRGEWKNGEKRDGKRAERAAFLGK